MRPLASPSQWSSGRRRVSASLKVRPHSGQKEGQGGPPSCPGYPTLTPERDLTQPSLDLRHGPASCPMRRQQIQQIISSHILLGASATADTSLNFIYPNPGAHMQVLPSGQLRIMHASPEDAGNYFCIAQNSVGSAMAKTRLVVQGGPRRDLQET